MNQRFPDSNISTFQLRSFRSWHLPLNLNGPKGELTAIGNGGAAAIKAQWKATGQDVIMELKGILIFDIRSSTLVNKIRLQ